jgi:hypothetical protein
VRDVPERVYEYLPYDWTVQDAEELQGDVLWDIHAHEEVAREVPFTATAQEVMGSARRLWDVYDVLGVLVESFGLVSVEDAWVRVQAKREECGA